MKNSRHPARQAESPLLGRLEVVRDQEGVKLMAHGTLYAVHPTTPAETPAPWLALAAATWMTERVLDGPGRPRRVALLGYGGGTVARLLLRASPDLEIIGVDLDVELIALARAHLAADLPGVRMVMSDAAEWLRRKGPRLDAILDDLYAPKAGLLGRPAVANDIPLLARDRLNSGGVYAVNLRSPGGEEERHVLALIRRTWPEVRVIYTQEYAHKVVLASDVTIPRGSLGRALARLLEPAGEGMVLQATPPVRIEPGRFGLRDVLRLPSRMKPPTP